MMKLQVSAFPNFYIQSQMDLWDTNQNLTSKIRAKRTVRRIIRPDPKTRFLPNRPIKQANGDRTPILAEA